MVHRGLRLLPLHLRDEQGTPLTQCFKGGSNIPGIGLQLQWKDGTPKHPL